MSTLDLGVSELARQNWDRDEVHQLFDNLQFVVLRERLFATLTTEQPEAAEGFDGVGAPGSEPGTVADFLAEHARDGRRVGLSFAGTWGRGSGTLNSVTLAAGDGEAGWLDVAALTEADERALAGWLADRDRAEGRARRQGPAAGAQPARLAAGGPDSRTPSWPPTWCSRASGPSSCPTWRCVT